MNIHTIGILIDFKKALFSRVLTMRSLVTNLIFIMFVVLP